MDPNNPQGGTPPANPPATPPAGNPPATPPGGNAATELANAPPANNAPANQAPTTGLPAGPNWLPGATAEDTAYVANKAWKDPGELLRSYQNLEKMVGADRAGRTVTLPGMDADEATKNEFFTKLGRPEAPDKYNVEIPKEDHDPEFEGDFRKTAFDLGLSDKQAEGLAKWWNAKQGDVKGRLTADQEFANRGQAAALQKEWGAAAEQNTQIAREAVKQLGITAEQLNAIQAGLGYDGVMKLMHKLGSKVGEGTLIMDDGGRAAGGGVMTPEQAKQEWQRLSRSKEYIAAATDKKHPDHAKMMERKSQLSTWMVGGQK